MRIAKLLWPVALIFAVLTAFAFIAGATWPSGAYVDFALLVFIVFFHLFLSSILLRRMHTWDWLTLSFISVFLTMSGVFLFALSRRLWPVFVNENLETILWFVRIPLLAALIWATVQLLLTPDPEIDQQRRRVAQRAEGRAEGHTAGRKAGHAAGRTKGHAEGMAQEHAEQLEREDAAQ